MAVKPYVGTIADAVEGQQNMVVLLLAGQAEGGAVPPTVIEVQAVNALIVSGCQGFGFCSASGEHSHQRRRYHSRIPPVGLCLRCRENCA